jgi:hypothetical protein
VVRAGQSLAKRVCPSSQIGERQKIENAAGGNSSFERGRQPELDEVELPRMMSICA